MPRLLNGLIAFIFCFLLVSVQVQAMPSIIDINFFLDSIDEAPPDSDVIAEVSITDTEKGSKLLAATVNIVEVVKSSDARVRQGEKIAVKSVLTGYGPHNGRMPSGLCQYRFNHNPGDKGTIIAKVGTDIEGRLVLCPYSNKARDGRINPPLAGECNPAEMEKAKQIKLEAENGDAKAQTALGLMYVEGRNTRCIVPYCDGSDRDKRAREFEPMF